MTRLNEKQDVGVIDFDRMFEDYAMEWFKEHGGEYESDEEMEEAMPDVYEQWASSPSRKLGGIAPRAFFDSIEDPDRLVAILVGTAGADCNPCSLLLDKIAETPECEPLLAALAEKPSSSVKLCLICMSLLEEAGGANVPVGRCLQWIKDETADEELRECAVEALKKRAGAVKEELFAALKDASIGLKTVIAEILVAADKDERTFKLLTELFASGENIPLYAQYLGMYGDERAAGVLYRALDTCDYADYIEVKNAIERLGGVVDDSARDFSDDETYHLLKK